MKKGIAFLVLVICAGILMVASSHSGMAWLTKVRYTSQAYFGSDKYTYGDLFGIAYLPEFKMAHDQVHVSKPVLKSAEKDIHLYVVGDSYFYSSFDLVPQYFERAQSLRFFKWDDRAKSLALPRDSARKVLLIECVERNVLNIVKLPNLHSIFESKSAPNSSMRLDGANEVIRKALYHPSLETNLAFALFDMSVYTPLKEWKAGFNQTVFGRSPAGVVLAKSKDFLYIEQTVDPNATGSSFKAVEDTEYQALLREMDLIESYAKNQGFDDVIFSFLPNPASILLTEGKPYNEFVPRVAKYAESRFLFIDPTAKLRVNASQNFFRNDSHWNPRGAKIWLDLSNELLMSLPKK